MADDLVARALQAARQYEDEPAASVPAGFTSDAEGEPVNFRPLNFDALRQANAVRVTNRANPDGTTDTDPNAGFSIVSGWNDAMAKHGDPRSTVTWPDNPGAYGTVADMFANNPEWITPHKYRQILHSARELGMRDEDVYAQPRAHGGEIDAALHAVRHHLAGGGFLSDLFSGPDYLSTGEVASPTNWGDPESAADFFKADKADRALRLAREAQAQADDVTGSIPVRAPLTAPRPGAVEVRDLPVNIPFAAPERGVSMLSSDISPASVTSLPLAYSPEAPAAPAAAAINQATGKLAARVDPNSDAERADNIWNRMLIQESGGRQFRPNGSVVTSPVGALGISQVMPSTGPEAAQLAGLPWSLERLRNDPEYNHALGRAYYEAQLERFGDPILAAAAYNGGPGRVASALRQARETGQPWTAFLRPETQNYVRVVGRAHGGSVDDALRVVREHHADGERVGNDDPRQWLQFGGQDMERAPAGLPIGQAVGTSAAYHTAEGLEDAAKLANQVRAGEVDPMSDEGIQRALNAAMVAQTGGLGGAPARAGETVLGAGPVRKAAQDEVSGLFDYSRLHEVPKVTQFDLPRVIPPRGVPERVTDLAANKDVRDKMAEVILEGQRMGGANWYNTDPLLEKFVEQLGPDAGQKAYRKYMDFVAATSPRSDVGTNVRNASYYYGRDMRGEGMPAVGDRNPQPYGHMAQRLHQMNAERVAGPGWDPLNNPKPASFVENLAGNQEPVTVDTHAFRLPAILAKDPRFLETAYLASKDAPKLNIQKLVMSGDMSLEDALKTPAYWQAQPKSNEYAAMEQYYKPIGRELGMTPAQTQASAWVGGGKLTGLASDESKPFLRFFDDRIMKTARETGMDPKDVLRNFISGKMSLYSKGGSVEDRALMLVSKQA